MDENTWRIVQIGMWMIGGQTAILGFFFLFIWNHISSSSKRINDHSIDLNRKIDDLSINVDRKIADLSAEMNKNYQSLNDKIDKNETKFDAKIDSIQHSINELDKRLYGIESVLHMKDCCVLKQDQNLKKAE
jgi:SMC interacting uncharacterized protein involved in chromosome segregation